MKISIAIFLFALIALTRNDTYNTSLCIDIEINSLHYFINQQQSNKDLTITQGNITYTYNLCSTVEVYCSYQNAVVVASMVGVDTTQGICTSYTQHSVTYLDGSTSTSGIKVEYVNNISETVVIKYPCNLQTKQYCPQPQATVLWDYFSDSIITFTIVIEIIGIILMVLGIYIYRGSIVLISCGSAFIVLTMFQSLFVYLRGVSSSVLQNVLILTVITSFFVGYIAGYFPKVGLFCLGAWIGFVLSLTLNNIAFYHIDSDPSNLMLYIVTPILSVGFGILIQFIKKTIIIFASSLIGSYLCLRALSWSLGAFPNQFTFAKKYHMGLEETVPWQFYLYVIALLILTASSSALQAWLFKKKMKTINQSPDLDQHFNKLQNEADKERQQLIQIRKFNQQGPKSPRVLHRNKPPMRKLIERPSIQQNDFSEEQEEQEQEQQQSESGTQYSQNEKEIPELDQNLLGKTKK